MTLFNFIGRDFCSSNPCKNGGSCINLEEKFECICPDFAKGPRCEGEIYSGIWGENKIMSFIQFINSNFPKKSVPATYTSESSLYKFPIMIPVI